MEKYAITVMSRSFIAMPNRPKCVFLLLAVVTAFYQAVSRHVGYINRREIQSVYGDVEAKNMFFAE